MQARRSSSRSQTIDRWGDTWSQHEVFANLRAELRPLINLLKNKSQDEVIGLLTGSPSLRAHILRGDEAANAIIREFTDKLDFTAKINARATSSAGIRLP